MSTHGQVSGRDCSSGRGLRLRWEAGRFVALEPDDAAPPDRWLAPALVDLQVNGYAGVDFQAPAGTLVPADLERAAAALRADGCTRFLLTLITDDWPGLLARLRHLRALRAASPDLEAAIAGWHLEGPFLSDQPGFCGAHPPEAMRNPTPEALTELRTAAGDLPVLLTLAPERPGALAAIAQAVAWGWRVSLGHTNADAATLAQAVAAGATGFTHLGNACPQALDRHDNILWRALELRGVHVSLIPDGVHVAPSLFRLLHRLLAGDRILYVTDAMAGAAAPPGLHPLGRLQLDVGADGVVRQPGRSNFAGSALRPVDGVLRAAAMTGTSWREVWPRASLGPARWLGLPAGFVPGAPADCCELRFEGDTLRALRVWRGGVPGEARVFED